MQKKFDSILEFTKLKERCVFCQEVLQACLTNFIGVRKSGMPEINVPINSGRVSFEIKRTTETYDVRAQVTLDIVTNTIVFTLPSDSDTPNLDQQVIKQAFIEMKPHVDLHCSNKKCRYNYSLTSYYMHSFTKTGNYAWNIPPVRLFLESFVTGKLVVQNDWILEKTSIYSLINEDADPIRVPFMDFEAMGKDKLLTRVQTLVTFG